MSVTIKSRIVSDVVIVDVAGKFDIGEDSLRHSVKTFLDEGRQHFLMNLADFLTSAAGVSPKSSRRGHRLAADAAPWDWLRRQRQPATYSNLQSSIPPLRFTVTKRKHCRI